MEVRIWLEPLFVIEAAAPLCDCGVNEIPLTSCLIPMSGLGRLLRSTELLNGKTHYAMHVEMRFVALFLNFPVLIQARSHVRDIDSSFILEHNVLNPKPLNTQL